MAPAERTFTVLGDCSLFVHDRFGKPAIMRAQSPEEVNNYSGRMTRRKCELGLKIRKKIPEAALRTPAQRTIVKQRPLPRRHDRA